MVAMVEVSAHSRAAGACQPQTTTSSASEASRGEAGRGSEVATRGTLAEMPIAISGAAMATTPIWASMWAANEPRQASSNGPAQISASATRPRIRLALLMRRIRL